MNALYEKKIKGHIDLIADNIFKKIKQDQDIDEGLYSGKFGIILFLLYYSEFTGEKRHMNKTIKYAEKIISELTLNPISYTYSSGLSGILYLSDFLRRQKMLDMDFSTINDDLDLFIINSIQKEKQFGYYDFLHGPLGAAFYLEKKEKNNGVLNDFTNYLFSIAEKNKDLNHLKWKSFIFPNKKEGYNLSLSHGMPSLIILLCRIYNTNTCNDNIKKMIIGAVNYIISQEIDYKTYGSHFPPYIIGNHLFKSRLAWCYGDLGIALAIWQAGKAMKESTWQQYAMNIFLDSTCRLSPSETDVIDAGICHGTAGLVMFYRRMYFETGLNDFKRATDYWINETMMHAKFDDGIAGYKSFTLEWKKDYSLLSGVAGIGLTLLSYLNNDSQNWDELFLLS